MVLSQLIGRLGNQCFQLATCIGYARKHGIDYCVPKATMAPHVWPNYFAHLSNCDFSKLRNPLLLRETEHSYQELPPPPPDNDVVLEGYWQSEKYFNHVREEILHLFNPEREIKRGWVSIHVRRGDYLMYPDKHPVVTEQYLYRAIYFLYNQGFSAYKVFSDDLDWCKDKLNQRTHPLFHFEYSENKEPLEDLKEMSCCEHNIIANSSFSWWGAWLNCNPDKIVIAPKVWFGEGNSHLSTVDLIPESWVTL